MAGFFNQASQAVRSAARNRQPGIADLINQQYAAANSRPVPQANRTTLGAPSMIDTTRADQFRQREIDLANQLSGVASGQQQGAGELAARRATANALGQA